MKKQLVSTLIQYIVQELTNEEAPISTIRLVKLLYLIDYEYYKKYQKTLTTIEWVKYKHGPYFFELPEVIRMTGFNLEVNEVPSEKGFSRTFQTYREIELSGILPFSDEGLINRVVNKWAREDLSEILNFVYKTKPMSSAVFNKRIDFSEITIQQKVSNKRQDIEIGEEVSTKIQSMLAAKKPIKVLSIQQFYDDEYYRAMNLLNRQDVSNIKFNGVIDISKKHVDLLSDYFE
ncbi:MAG: Panacea domain-containing protein [Anaerolineaceae bacterium]